MRVKKVFVDNLFGMFNHEVELNYDERITIVHAPNGFGKTTILKIIKYILENKLAKLNEVFFDRIKIDFDNNTSVIIKKDKKNNESNIIEYNIITNNFNESVQLSIDKKNIYDIIREEMPFLRKIGEDYWLDRRDGKRLDYINLLSYLNEEGLFPYETEGETPEWFINFIGHLDEIPVRFVQAQRLLQKQQDNKNRRYIVSGKSNFINENESLQDSVILYSKELQNKLDTKLAESASISQKLDRSFPTRLIDKMMNLDENYIYSQKVIDEELSKLENKRLELEEVGLLYKAAPTNINENNNEMDEHTRSVLSLYINDTKKKLEVFEELQKKIKLMKDIINKRFIKKEMIITKEEGMIFKLSSGRKLKPNQLSSGEQHELVLLYELIFKTAPDSLVLIDEPEISLHVMWQQQFLNDLIKISDLTDIDIFIATHSPQIIHDRWDLTVSLEG